MQLLEFGKSGNSISSIIREFPKLESVPFAKYACPTEPLLVQQLYSMSIEALDNPNLEEQVDAIRLLCRLLSSGNGDEPPVQKMIGMGFYELLRKFSHSTGLLTPEALAGGPNDHLVKILRTENEIEVLQREARDMHDQGKRIGIYHGSFDPAHFGHEMDTRVFFDYVDYVIVAIEPEWLLRARKNSARDPRPRVPNRLWTMAQMAAMPAVDRVIELPIEEGHDIDIEFLEIMKSFSAQYLCTRDDNPLLPIFKKQTEQLGGKTVTLRTLKPPFSWFMPQSSTQVVGKMKRRGNNYFERYLEKVGNREQEIQDYLNHGSRP